jgi:hypothetical protein
MNPLNHHYAQKTNQKNEGKNVMNPLLNHYCAQNINPKTKAKSVMNSLNFDYGQSITIYTQMKPKINEPTNHINEQSITPTKKETLMQ